MKKILMAIIMGCLLASCSEEIYDSMAGSGNKVTLKLSYQELMPEEIKVTRSTATSAENALNNLQVFIFDKNGKLKGYKWISGTENLNQTGKATAITVKTTSGESYIYGVANVPTSLYSLSSEKTMIPTSSDKAWNEDDVQDGKSSFTLGDLKKIAFNRTAEEYDITDDQFMMSGMVNDGNSVTIDNTGNISTGSNLIELRRIVAKIKFIVQSGTGVTFTPSSYEIHNIPCEGQLIDDVEINVNAKTFETKANGVFEYKADKETSKYTYYFENVYLPENRQNQNLTTENSKSITTWTDRETDYGNKVSLDKEFSIAPPNSTYVMFKGTFKSVDSEGNRTDGDVKYFVHLGDFKTSLLDFNVDRNCFYTYTVTVNGVNSISVDVNKDTDGSGEGLVLENNGERISYLDSHYGQVDMTFNKSDISYNTNTGEKFIYFMAEDYRGKTGICKLSQDANGNFSLTEGDEEVTWDEPSCLDWIEFMEGSKCSYPSETSKKDNNGKTYFSGLVSLLKYLMNSYSTWGNNEQKKYTCFVNENYYENTTWDKYVNRDSRYVYICKELLTSTDRKNIRGTVIYGISQYSIQTIYNPQYAQYVDDDNKVVAFGCETIRSNDSNYSIYNEDKAEITNFEKGSGTDSWDGLANMKTDLGFNSNYLNYTLKWDGLSYSYRSGKNKTTGNYSYSYAKYACLSRNRDLDGDGIIDDDEVRWYCPTIEQYAGLWIGEEGISDTKARLVSGNTSSLQNKYWSNRPDPAVHYYANYGPNMFYWAEEGLSVGSVMYDANGNQVTSVKEAPIPHAVRCIRNLESKGKGLGTATKFYQVNNKVIDLSYLNTDAVRTIYQENELGSHYERGTTSYINAPAKKFAYSTGYASSENVSSILSGSTTNCSKYTDSSNDSYKWRAPNQRELSLLYLVANNEDTSALPKEYSTIYVGCRTQMSIDTNTMSWKAFYDTNSKSFYMQSASASENVYIRCVRDVK